MHSTATSLLLSVSLLALLGPGLIAAEADLSSVSAAPVAAPAVPPALVTPASVTPASVTPASVTPASVTPAAVAVAAPTSAHPVESPTVSEGPNGFSIEVGEQFYLPNDRQLRLGTGVFLTLGFPVKEIETGIRTTFLELHSEADDNQTGLADDVRYDLRLFEMLIQRQVINHMRIGMTVGGAQVKATLANNGDGGPTGVMFEQVVPTGEIFLALPIISGGGRIPASLDLSIGYRFLYIHPQDPDLEGTDYTDNIGSFSGLRLGLSVAARF